VSLLREKRMPKMKITHLITEINQLFLKGSKDKLNPFYIYRSLNVDREMDKNYSKCNFNNYSSLFSYSLMLSEIPLVQGDFSLNRVSSAFLSCLSGYFL
jgi:hypothetical protein